MHTQPPSPPAAFLGHGSPMNVLERNAYSGAWQRFGRSIARPRAILAVSAHWYVRGTRVTAGAEPRTIHDFSGWPAELYRFRYPAPGSDDLGARVIELLAPEDVRRDATWGLDHGTYGVLAHVFPQADVPVVQLSLDRTKTALEHYELAKRLRPLRDEGVLIVGSGNVVHNLEIAVRDFAQPPLDFARRFERFAFERLEANDHASLVGYEAASADARLAVPTPEHYLPLLYVAAQAREGERVTRLVDGIEAGAIGMLSVAIGA